MARTLLRSWKADVEVCIGARWQLCFLQVASTLRHVVLIFVPEKLTLRLKLLRQRPQSLNIILGFHLENLIQRQLLERLCDIRFVCHCRLRSSRLVRGRTVLQLLLVLEEVRKYLIQRSALTSNEISELLQMYGPGIYEFEAGVKFLKQAEVILQCRIVRLHLLNQEPACLVEH